MNLNLIIKYIAIKKAGFYHIPNSHQLTLKEVIFPYNPLVHEDRGCTVLGTFKRTQNSLKTMLAHINISKNKL